MEPKSHKEERLIYPFSRLIHLDYEYSDYQLDVDEIALLAGAAVLQIFFYAFRGILSVPNIYTLYWQDHESFLC